MRIGPNFLIIGANKGGTTSLFQYLRQHPEVFVPKIKEPMFFNYYQEDGEDENFRTQKIIKTFSSYSQLFEGSEAFKARGEASTSYLANPDCAKNIYNFNPAMKLIVLLRNPIERAFSNYLMYVRWKDEKRSFSAALQDELKGVALPQGKQYIYLGHYLHSLRIYKEQFGEGQLKVILFEDFKNTPLKTYREVCNYLKIDEGFEPFMKKKYNNNDSVEIRFPHKYLKNINKHTGISRLLPKGFKRIISNKPRISSKDKEVLKRIYKNEISELSHFINRDLSHWLDC